VGILSGSRLRAAKRGVHSCVASRNWDGGGQLDMKGAMKAETDTAALLQRALGHFARAREALTQERRELTAGRGALATAMSSLAGGDPETGRRSLADAAAALERVTACGNDGVAASTRARHAIEAALRSLPRGSDIP
jgi:hypothetical protein